MEIFNVMVNKITINGKSYSGKNMTIINGVVFIDGKEQDGQLTPNITIQINGDVGSVRCESGNVTVTGSVRGDVETASGGIRCGDVGGSVKTMSGSVSSGNIAGSANSMTGNIVIHR